MLGVVVSNLENQHEDVYGKSFALYGEREMREFIEPFAIRFERNDLDPPKVFTGKRCLDAGCGNGRGAIFMMSHGAAAVDCVDISETNIESTARNLKNFGFPKFTTHLSTLEGLPFPDEAFDFVWCNGVIMHAAQPDACLVELVRVLKRGSQCWLYIYGTGGLYWWMVRRFRELLAEVSPATSLAALQLMRYPARYVAEYMDDWKVPYLRTYSIEDLGGRLRELGFENVTPLSYGVDYDTSHRRNIYPEDRPWVGDGDLRYLLTKVREPVGHVKRLSSSEFGSEPRFASVIDRRFGHYFSELSASLVGAPMIALTACGHIQKELREIMSRSGRFDIDAVEAAVERVVTLVRLVVGASVS
jgi:ubiquinone/menaquinone biosynthesis C-methylase UbiE